MKTDMKLLYVCAYVPIIINVNKCMSIPFCVPVILLMVFSFNDKVEVSDNGVYFCR